MKPGTRVKFKDGVDREKFGVTEEDWASNPKTGTVIPHKYGNPEWVFVKMDKEFEEFTYEQDLTVWLQNEFEIMEPNEIEEIGGTND